MVLALACLVSGYSANSQQAGVASFEDASSRLGPLQTQRTWGVTWTDFNNDGWPDLFLSNHHINPPYVLRNESGNSFTNISTGSALSKRTDHHSCKWADHDRDADWDVYCSTGADMGTKLVPKRFMRNQGNGVFVDIAAETGTAFPDARGRTVSWLDIDKDGDLDLFFGTDTQAATQPLSRIYRNDGPIFTNVTAASGVVLNGLARISIPADLDGDDDTDLLLAFRARKGTTFPCVHCMALLINDGNGHFQAIDAGSRGLGGISAQAVAVGDYDNDGDLDVFQGTQIPSAKLHRNNGNLTFTEISLASAGMSAVDDFPVVDAHWADFDNDGHLDLFAVRQSADEVSNAPDILLVNDGDGTFTDRTAQFNAAGLSSGRGDAAAIADFDKNGFLDLVISNGHGATPGSYQLLRNRGNSNQWIRLALTDANGSPLFGSKVQLFAGGQPQYREYGDTGGDVASHEHVVHFGLGSATSVDLIRVRWPDGSVTEQFGIGSGQLVEIQKSPGGPVDVEVPDVVGMTRGAAEAAIQGVGLPVGTVNSATSDSVPAGRVISQGPAGNSSVAPGTPVSLTVSTGASTAVVPDVVGLTQSAAEAAIGAVGLAVGAVDTATSEAASAGDVISQDPAAETVVGAGSTVVLVVSIGPVGVTVPDVVSLTQGAAENAIVDAGLAVGTVGTASSVTVPEGTVISQEPAGGSTVAPGTNIALTISTGPGTVTVPDVVNLVQAAAESQIVGAGLVVGAVGTASSDTVPAGRVILQDPAGSSTVAPGTSVSLTVSTGPGTVAVPDVVNLTQAEAGNGIVGAGLVVGAVGTASSATVPAGRVISQDPEGGISVGPGTSVALVISSGAGAEPYLNFDGGNDRVVIPNRTSLRLANAVTVEAWIRPRTIAGSTAQDRVLKKGNNYELHISTGDTGCAGGTSGHVQWRATIAGTNSRICGGVLTPGLWHHVAGTYNGTGFALYLNGNLVASRTRSGKMALGTAPLVIGNNGEAKRGFDGGIDEVAIWSRALTASEIQNRFAEQLSGNENGLAGHWSFDEASGQSVLDASPNANHGTLGVNGNADSTDPMRAQ